MTSNGAKNVQLVALLAAGHSYDDCAAALGVSKRAIVRLNANSAFAAKVREARSLLLQQTVGVLAAQAVATVRTLIELRDHGAEATRLGASRTLLDKLASTREQVDLEARMGALEAALATQRMMGHPGHAVQESSTRENDNVRDPVAPSSS